MSGLIKISPSILSADFSKLGEEVIALEKAGADLNGSMTPDRTNYWETVPSNYLETALWLESDRMGWLLSTVTQSAFMNQQEVVQNEKRQRVDNRPYGHANYVMIKNMYPEGHPYNWTTIGELEDLQKATLKDVRDFYENGTGPIMQPWLLLVTIIKLK